MKQILLAINGSIPRNATFQYAVTLCKTMHAQLRILQFTKDKRLTQRISSTKNQVGRLGKFLENSFAGVAFAEQGAFDMADNFFPDTSDSLKELIQNNKIGIPFKVGVGRGNLKKELSNYIGTHQKIILTIFDPSKDTEGITKQQFEMIEQIKRELFIPLVLIK